MLIILHFQRNKQRITMTRLSFWFKKHFVGRKSVDGWIRLFVFLVVISSAMKNYRQIGREQFSYLRAESLKTFLHLNFPWPDGINSIRSIDCYNNKNPIHNIFVNI